MRTLLVYCHPNPESFCAHLRDTAVAALRGRGEVRVHDLYGEGFNPVMCREERLGYHTPGENERPVARELADLKWCDTVVFVYPTWWFGLPAMLKGWLDRVLVPHATFTLPTAEQPIRPQLSNVRAIVAVTTCGARNWQSKLIGEPGRKTLLRALRAICHRRCRTRYLALHKIDSSTRQGRARYSAKVARVLAAL